MDPSVESRNKKSLSAYWSALTAERSKYLSLNF